MKSFEGYLKQKLGDNYILLAGGGSTIDKGFKAFGVVDIRSTGSNRANINMITVADLPNDFYLGSNNTAHWSITSRNSAESNLLAFYSTSRGYTATVDHISGVWNFTENPTVGAYSILNSNNYTDYLYTKLLSDDRYVNVTGDTMSGTLTITKYGPTVNNYVANSWAFQSFESYNSSDTNSRNIYHIGTIYSRDTFEIRRYGSDTWAFGPTVFYGFANNTYYLGSTTYRWANIYSTFGNFSSTLTAGTVSTGKIHSTASSSTDLTHHATDSEIALETGNGDGNVSAWIWRENYSSNWGMFHDNSTNDVIFVGGDLEKVRIGLGSTSLKVGGTEVSLVGHTHSEYSLTSHTHTAIYNNLDIFSAPGGNYGDGLRIHSRGSGDDWCSITFCASDNTGTGASGMTTNSWYLGVHGGNLYIGKSATGMGSEHHLRSVNQAWDCSGTWNLASNITSGGTITSTCYGPAFHAYVGNGGFSFTRYTSYNSSKSYWWDIGTYVGEEDAFHIRYQGNSNWRFNATEFWGAGNYYLGRSGNRWSEIYSLHADISSTSKFGNTLYIGPTANYGSYNEGIRIYQAANDWGGILFARRGELSSPNDGTSTNSWFLATNGNNMYINKGTSSPPTASRLMGHSNGWTVGNTDMASCTLNVGGSIYCSSSISIYATSGRSSIYLVSSTNEPNDLWFGSNGTSHWSFTSRESTDPWIGLYRVRDGSWAFTISNSANTISFGYSCYAPNYYTTSDRTKKKNINQFSEHISKFTLKETDKDAYGVIAQEVPEMFRDGKEGDYTVNYNSVLSYYVGCLENKVAELEEKIKELENK